MRKVYYTLDLTEAVLLKDHLLHNNVAASVRSIGAVHTLCRHRVGGVGRR